MNHLGERLTALVDGELGHAERERAFAHLAVCDACRGEADVLRRIKRRVHELPGPGPSAGLLGTLLDLGGDELNPRDDTEYGTRSMPAGISPLAPHLSSAGRFPATGPGDSLPPAAAAAAFLGLTDNPPLGTRPFAARPFGLRAPAGGRSLPLPGGRRLSARSLVVGAFSIAAVTVGSAFLAGGGSGGAAKPAPAVTPPVRSFAVEHALTTGELISGRSGKAVPRPRPAAPAPSASQPAAARPAASQSAPVRPGVR